MRFLNERRPDRYAGPSACLQLYNAQGACRTQAPVRTARHAPATVWMGEIMGTAVAGKAAQTAESGGATSSKERLSALTARMLATTAATTISPPPSR
jgi:hypothetical protein